MHAKDTTISYPADVMTSDDISVYMYISCCHRTFSICSNSFFTASTSFRRLKPLGQCSRSSKHDSSWTPKGMPTIMKTSPRSSVLQYDDPMFATECSVQFHFSSSCKTDRQPVVKDRLGRSSIPLLWDRLYNKQASSRPVSLVKMRV